MDSNPMVSSLLNKLANYTNLSQGVVEHEEDEDSRRREIKVPSTQIAVREYCCQGLPITPTLFLLEAWPTFIFWYCVSVDTSSDPYFCVRKG